MCCVAVVKLVDDTGDDEPCVCVCVCAESYIELHDMKHVSLDDLANTGTISTSGLCDTLHTAHHQVCDTLYIHC